MDGDIGYLEKKVSAELYETLSFRRAIETLCRALQLKFHLSSVFMIAVVSMFV